MVRYSLLFIFFLSFLASHAYAEQGFIVESIGNMRTIESRKNLIKEVLSSDEMQFGYRALSIVLDSGLIEPRGQMK